MLLENRMRTHGSLVLCLGSVLMLSSCGKDPVKPDPPDPGPCSGFSAPVVSNSGAAASGDTVYLLAVTPQPDVDFEWTGPNGFAAMVQQPAIEGAGFLDNGIYKARIRNLICVSAWAETAVTVAAPCPAIDLNTADVDGTPWYFYTNVLCGPLGTNLNYGVTATSSYGEMYIQFTRPDAPKGYAIFGVSLLPGLDTTLVSMRIHQNNTDFHATGGDLYVGNDGTSVIFVFCGITFTSAGSVSYAVSAYLRCD